MKKVICINDKEFGDVGRSPINGSVCSVRRSFIDGDNDPVYVLDNYDGVFSQRYFADEAIVNLETA